MKVLDKGLVMMGIFYHMELEATDWQFTKRSRRRIVCYLVLMKIRATDSP